MYSLTTTIVVVVVSLRHTIERVQGHSKYQFCYVLSVAPWITAFHIDPDYGGGYM